LKGHDRPISDVQFNHDGDLVFSSSKDGTIQVWSAETGERMGTYAEGTSATNCISVNRESTRLLSAHGNSTVELWEVETGKRLYTYAHDVSVKCVDFADGGKQFLSITEPQLGFSPYIHVYDLPDDNRRDQMIKPSRQIQVATSTKENRVLKAIWGYHNETIFSANEDGTLRIYNVERGAEIKSIKAHEKAISTVQLDYYKILFVTASKDGTAKLWDYRQCEPIKTYEVGRPLNAAAISPLLDHVILGGGESAMEVTTTQATTEQFKVRFYHSIMCHELGSVLGHFGPVNALDFSPDGKSFVSGSEDGFLRLHFMDESYFARRDEYRLVKK
jgi:translation initiation factor 3 subunit I